MSDKTIGDMAKVVIEKKKRKEFQTSIKPYPDLRGFP